MFHYILEGKTPIRVDLTTWSTWFQTADRHVKRDNVGGTEVSTIFLGLDHRFGDGPPILYETMIFGGPDHHYQERYCTWEEAEKGHERAVNMVKGGNILQENNLL